MVIGHRSAIRHTRCCPICKSISGVQRRHAVNSEESIENNKQHAVGIEQISKEKKSSLCARLFNRNKHWNEWSMDEADNSKRRNTKRKRMSGQKGFTFN